MPVITLSAVTGKDVPGLIESLERQRKELEFILTSLDNDNVLELSGNLINEGVVQAKHVSVGSETSFQEGYDPSGINFQNEFDELENRIDTMQAVVSALETKALSLQGEIDAAEILISTMQTEVDTLETNLATLQTEVDTLETDLTTLQTEVITPIETRLGEAEADILALQDTP